MTEQIDQWLLSFNLADFLRPHVAEVFAALPAEVRHDLMDDPDFVLYDYEPGVIMHVPMRLSARGPARTVVLKRTLRRRPVAFVRWLIAHELAHAFMRHGLVPGTNDEAAADDLAAEWGFPKAPW